MTVTLPTRPFVGEVIVALPIQSCTGTVSISSRVVDEDLLHYRDLGIGRFARRFVGKLPGGRPKIEVPGDDVWVRAGFPIARLGLLCERARHLARRGADYVGVV